MRNSTLLLTESLNKKLLEFPKLVDSLERKEINFISNLFLWINELESIFSSHHLSEVSELAGLRSKIIAVKYSDGKKKSTKVHQVKTASEILYDLQNTILSVLKPKEMKVGECRELLRKLLIITSRSSGLQYQSGEAFEIFIQKVWREMVANEKLVSGTINLRSILSSSEIHQLIAEEIDLEDF